MSEDIKQMMQISIIEENTILSNMIQDIVPIKEKKFTDIELEINKNETFSLVLYQKPNVFRRFWSKIQVSLEKLKIIKNIKQYDYAKNKNI